MLRHDIGTIGPGFVGQAMLKLFGDCPIFDPAKGFTDRHAPETDGLPPRAEFEPWSKFG